MASQAHLIFFTTLLDCSVRVGGWIRKINGVHYLFTHFAITWVACWPVKMTVVSCNLPNPHFRDCLQFTLQQTCRVSMLKKPHSQHWFLFRSEIYLSQFAASFLGFGLWLSLTFGVINLMSLDLCLQGVAMTKVGMHHRTGVGDVLLESTQRNRCLWKVVWFFTLKWSNTPSKTTQHFEHLHPEDRIPTLFKGTTNPCCQIETLPSEPRKGIKNGWSMSGLCHREVSVDYRTLWIFMVGESHWFSSSGWWSML